jgi:hypothetical protein
MQRLPKYSGNGFAVVYQIASQHPLNRQNFKDFSVSELPMGIIAHLVVIFRLGLSLDDASGLTSISRVF